MHELEPDEEYEYDTIQIIRKVKFSSSCRKEHDSNKNNVMFDEIVMSLSVILECYQISMLRVVAEKTRLGSN